MGAPVSTQAESSQQDGGAQADHATRAGTSGVSTNTEIAAPGSDLNNSRKDGEDNGIVGMNEEGRHGKSEGGKAQVKEGTGHGGDGDDSSSEPKGRNKEQNPLRRRSNRQERQRKQQEHEQLQDQQLRVAIDSAIDHINSGTASSQKQTLPPLQHQPSQSQARIPDRYVFHDLCSGVLSIGRDQADGATVYLKLSYQRSTKKKGHAPTGPISVVEFCKDDFKAVEKDDVQIVWHDHLRLEKFPGESPKIKEECRKQFCAWILDSRQVGSTFFSRAEADGPSLVITLPANPTLTPSRKRRHSPSASAYHPTGSSDHRSSSKPKKRRKGNKGRKGHTTG